MRHHRWLVITLLLLTSRPAHAECDKPVPFFSPPAGTTLPHKPTVFLFVPAVQTGQAERAAPEVVVVSPTGASAVVKRLSSPPAFGAFRIAVKMAADGPLELELRPAGEGKSPLKVSYTVSGAWKRPALTPIQVADPSAASVLKAGGGKIDTQTFSFHGVGAPAYRVEHAASLKAFRESPHKRVVLPASLTGFDYEGLKDLKMATLVLGETECHGVTHFWSMPIFVAVVAIFPDGSETPLPDKPYLLPLPKTEMARTMAALSAPAERQQEQVETGFLTIQILLVVIVIVGVGLGLRRAMKRVKRRKGVCVACGSRKVRPVDGDEERVECADCGYVGNRDQGGEISFEEIHDLHGKPIDKLGDALKKRSDTWDRDL